MIDSFCGEYRFLSNFYPSSIEYKGVKYPTVEHAFQATKSLDLDDRLFIAKLETPGKAKRAGRNLILRKDWEEIKIEVMRELLVLKFKDDSLANKLKKTEPHELIEGNTWGDKFWGVCNGEGQNWLGKLLMEIREEL